MTVKEQPAVVAPVGDEPALELELGPIVAAAAEAAAAPLQKAYL